MFHMGGTEHLLATLMSGGQGFVNDGFNARAIVDIIEHHAIGWLMLVPSTVEPLVTELHARGVTPRSVRAVGCMADLVPAAEIEAITRAVNAPYLNSFGATETGMPPLSGHMLDIGTKPDLMSKRLSILTDLRLADDNGEPVRRGDIGEAWVRGPTVFSGYWNAPQANAQCFSDGWYRMGDLFRQSEAGYDFIGRSKYLIKSGGENIYPAEIERILLADARVSDAIVVRIPDDRWGEVPVAVIARHDERLDYAEVETMLSSGLARYKRPRHVLFVGLDDFPRNISGKILREAVEMMVVERLAAELAAKT
jgi:acyl-CoA synthetase (AMP-forming)/AMP-acid ligase II